MYAQLSSAAHASETPAEPVWFLAPVAGMRSSYTCALTLVRHVRALPEATTPSCCTTVAHNCLSAASCLLNSQVPSAGRPPVVDALIAHVFAEYTAICCQTRNGNAHVVVDLEHLALV